MADFVAVLRKTLDGLGDTTPETRARVYDKARATVAAKLAAIDPPPPAALAERQQRALEDAIASIEQEFAATSDPLAELENVFASLKNPQPKVLSRQQTPERTESAWPKSVPPQAPPRHEADPLADEEPDFEAPEQPETHDGEDRGEFARYRPEPARRRSYGGLIVAGLVLAVAAGGGYGVWLNRDAFGGLLGLAQNEAALEPPAAPEPAAAVPAAAPPAPAPEIAATPVEPAVAAPAAAPESETPKFTQRLTPEGAEVDPGPADGTAELGEGTSVAALTQLPPPPAAAEPSPAEAPPAAAVDISPADTPAGAGPVPAPPAEASAPTAPEGVAPAPAPPAEAAPAAPPAAAVASVPAETSVPVGQRAIFYEERTASSEGSAEPGSIVWSMVQESPGADLPPEPAIRAEATIPGKSVQLRMTIRRNADPSLPASHIIEMIFLTPDGFEGGGIDNILRVAMKGSEQEAGNPLIGIPAKIADGFFLVALNDTKPEMDANLGLLRRQSWIDVPIIYKSGRRALFTMEKGVPGEKIFEDTLNAWTAPAPASAPG